MTLNELKQDPPSALFALWWLFQLAKCEVYLNDGGDEPEKPESAMEAYKHFFDVDGLITVCTKKHGNPSNPTYCFEGIIDRGNDQSEEIYDGLASLLVEIEQAMEETAPERKQFDAWFENELLDEEKCRFFVDFYCGD